jgi:4-hydroxybenzoate polyprenyltransferase
MIKRIAIYLNEMFPLSSFLGSILTALAVQLTYLRLFDAKPSSILPLLVPGLVITFVSLLIRIMDEFKDYDDDLTNFPNRPLPSGRVLKKDLLWLAFFCIFAVIFLSLTSTQLLLWALITLGFTFLMLKWFFIEDIMRKSLPLAFVTHHPIVLFNFV